MSCLKKLHRSFIYFLSTVLPSVVSSLTSSHEFSPSLSLIPKQHSNCSFTYSAMPSPLLLCLSFLQSLCPSISDVLLNPQELKKLRTWVCWICTWPLACTSIDNRLCSSDCIKKRWRLLYANKCSRTARTAGTKKVCWRNHSQNLHTIRWCSNMTASE